MPFSKDPGSAENRFGLLDVVGPTEVCGIVAELMERLEQRITDAQRLTEAEVDDIADFLSGEAGQIKAVFLYWDQLSAHGATPPDELAEASKLTAVQPLPGVDLKVYAQAMTTYARATQSSILGSMFGEQFFVTPQWEPEQVVVVCQGFVLDAIGQPVTKTSG